MKIFFLIFILGISSISAEKEWPALISKFSNDIVRLTSFFSLPRTSNQALDEHWVQPNETVSDHHLTTLCRKKDPSVCLLYDGKNTITGYQISIPKTVDTLKMPSINYEDNGFKSTRLFGTDMYSIAVYFDSQDSILKGGRQYESINGSEPQTGNGLWIPLKGKGLVQVPRYSKELKQKIPEFTKQACYPGMSTHWFYKMSRSLEPQSFYPIFLLYDEGSLIGFGFNAFGSNVVEKTLKDYIPIVARRKWFESPIARANAITPDAPDWMAEYSEKYGVFTHHVYFIEKPWQVHCLSADSSDDA